MSVTAALDTHTESDADGWIAGGGGCLHRQRNDRWRRQQFRRRQYYTGAARAVLLAWTGRRWWRWRLLQHARW